MSCLFVDKLSDDEFSILRIINGLQNMLENRYIRVYVMQVLGTLVGTYVFENKNIRVG